MSAPWMPLYIGDYLKDTARLSTAEHGACLLLIMDYWVNGGLTDDDTKLARITRLSESEWKKCKNTVLEFFEKKLWWDGRSGIEHALGIGRREYRPAISPSTRALVAERDEFKCVYCGKDDGPFDVDHVHPFSRGGAHSIENFAWSCASCNRSKGARFPNEWKSEEIK